MIDVKKLERVDHIVSHYHCADGMASAMILRDAIPSAKVSFIQYQSPEHLSLEAKPGMLFCDFSPHRDRVGAFVEAGAIVLDHHKFAKDVVEAFGEDGVFADETASPGVSGAVLAFEQVWVPLAAQGLPEGNPEALKAPLDLRAERIKDFAVLAGIRDTWLTGNPRWRESCDQREALVFWPSEDLLATPWNEWPIKLALGPVLFDKQLRKAAETAEGSYRFTTDKGLRVAMFGGVTITSDAAETIGAEADLVVGFSYKVEAGGIVLVFSTRSHTDFDCGSFCKAHGGGGHTKAAGFKVSVGPTDLNPFDHFRAILEEYE